MIIITVNCDLNTIKIDDDDLPDDEIYNGTCSNPDQVIDIFIAFIDILNEEGIELVKIDNGELISIGEW